MRKTIKITVFMLLCGLIGGMSSLTAADADDFFNAVKTGQLEKVKTLLDKNKDLADTPDEQMYFPLHWAVFKGHRKVAELLIERGADVNRKTEDHYQFTPLHWASTWETASLLVKKGADINARDRYESPPITWAAAHDRSDVIEFLLTLGADINDKDVNGWTGLHWAAHKGLKEAAEILIDNEAQVNPRNRAKETPLHRAVKRKNKELIALLLEKNAAVNPKDENGWAPLHMAALDGDTEAAKMLLAKEAPFDSKDYDGKTPAQLAEKHDHPDTAKLLGIESPEPHSEKKVTAKKAIAWYLGSYGWAVKTENYFLVFDYLPPQVLPGNPTLANGHINLKEIKDWKVYVFLSHFPQQLFLEKIYKWRESVKDIHFVSGFQGDVLGGYTQMKPREKRSIDKVEVTALDDGDNGLGFLVKADGISILHTGHLGAWEDDPEKMKTFTAEIDWLNEQKPGVDIAFAAAARNMFEVKPCTVKGIYYLMEKLGPGTLFPMGFAYEEYLYKPFVREAAEKKDALKTKVEDPRWRGEHFYFKF